MRPRNRMGFTIIELLFALVIGAMLVLAPTRFGESVDRVGAATRAGADARALEWTTERVLRRALEEAGSGMPSAPNLGGIGVRVAARGDGTPADTLVVLRGASEAMAVSARTCRAGVPSPCLALVGDQRGRLRAGDLIVVGARGPGLSAFQVTADPAVFVAPCGGDCPERLICPVSPGPLQSFVRVVGSIRQPSGTASPAPCPHAFFADGTRCEEVVQSVAGGASQVPACRAQGPSSPFTEVRVADRTALLGFPPPPMPLASGGAGAAPRVRAVPVRVSRFWVRAGPGGDSVLVRQNGMDGDGTWRSAVTIAGPMIGLRVESLQVGGAWAPGAGVAAAEVLPVGGNANYTWRAAPSASGREPGTSFTRGHHTIGAVRIRYLYRSTSPSRGLPVARDAWMVVPTPALLEGGTGDTR
jgi:pilin/secretion family protein with methylation motif